MTKNILIAVAAILLLTGCGSNPADAIIAKQDLELKQSLPQLPTASVQPRGAQSGYLIDEQWNSFGKVNYECAGREGTTGADSKFYYTIGDTCTFYMPADTSTAWFLHENRTRIRGLQYVCYGEGECTIIMSD